MDQNQTAAYVMSQAASAMIEAMGMFTENAERHRQGQSPAYTEDDFNGLINKYGIHHNAVMGFLST